MDENVKKISRIFAVLHNFTEKKSTRKAPARSLMTGFCKDLSIFHVTAYYIVGG